MRISALASSVEVAHGVVKSLTQEAAFYRGTPRYADVRERLRAARRLLRDRKAVLSAAMRSLRA